MIPLVLVTSDGCVVTTRFSQRRRVGSVAQVASIYARRDIDELILLDIDARKEGRLVDPDWIETMARDLWCPLTAGGGVRSVEDAKKLLDAGADKVSVSLSAPAGLVRDLVYRLGSQAVVFVFDVATADINWRLRQVAEFEVGEIVLQDVVSDGQRCGFRFLDAVDAAALPCPLIHAGGAASPEDFVRAAKAGASGAAAAAMFHFSEHTPASCRNALRDAGFEVRG